MSGSSRTLKAALAVLVVGGGVLFLSEAEWLRVIGATVAVAGIVLGVFAIATPEFLGEDRDDPDPG